MLRETTSRFVGFGMILGLACAGPPEPEPEPLPAALPLPIEDGHRAGCALPEGCEHWFAVEVVEDSVLTVTAVRFAGPEALEIQLADAEGEPIAEPALFEGGQAQAHAPVVAGVSRVLVRTQPGAIYEVLAEAGASAPAAGTTAARWTVLEVEGDPEGSPSVVIDGGRIHQIRRGQRGTLVDGDRTIGQIEIIDVFEEGSRARVVGTLEAPVTSATIAVIQTP